MLFTCAAFTATSSVCSEGVKESNIILNSIEQRQHFECFSQKRVRNVNSDSRIKFQDEVVNFCKVFLSSFLKFFAQG